jgi:hypothetical protein
LARKPNYSFERMERERLKALKLAERAAAKRERREAGDPPDASSGSAAPGDGK